MKNSKQQGDFFENLAKQFLQQQGLQFFCQNWQYKKLGELDLVMIDNEKLYKNQLDTLVVVEVRKRKAGQFGTATESISTAKQRKIINTTQAFLQCYPQFFNHDIRFDVVGFDVNFEQNLPVPVWLKSAFIVET